MIFTIEIGPEENNVAFGDKDTTQETSTGGQDGEDLHGHHGFPLGAQVSGYKGDPNTAKHQHAEGDQLGFVKAVGQFPCEESYQEANKGKKTHVA